MPSQVCVDREVGLGPRLRGWAAWLKGVRAFGAARLSLEGGCGLPEAWLFGKTRPLEASSRLIQSVF